MTLVLSHPALADSGSVGSVESFIQSVIKVIASLAGLVATGFFVVGGFGYITSSGNPEHLDRSKRTILYSAIGLAITIAAFVISNIVVTLATNAFGS
jgi:TRAP-type C4-dicarboxylate transport system permease small subunit